MNESFSITLQTCTHVPIQEHNSSNRSHTRSYPVLLVSTLSYPVLLVSSPGRRRARRAPAHTAAGGPLLWRGALAPAPAPALAAAAAAAAANAQADRPLGHRAAAAAAAAADTAAGGPLAYGAPAGACAAPPPTASPIAHTSAHA